MTFAARPNFGTAQGIITLSGGTIQSINQGRRALLHLRAAGGTDQQIGATITPINTATDWIRPLAAVGTVEYEAKWTVVISVGDPFYLDYTTGWDEDTWADLTSDLYTGWNIPINNNSAGDFTVTIRRKADQVVEATAVYDIAAVDISV